ncbi:MAG TPA: hypothetical protein VIC71_13500 [Gammaproteobacteria bacterium]|jgi:hypothetical protein
MNMPTTRSNAEAIARARGYAVTVEDGRIAIHTRDGELVHRTTKWAAALQFLLEAPRLGNVAAPQGRPSAGSGNAPSR